jgi:hypothetical protein
MMYVRVGLDGNNLAVHWECNLKIMLADSCALLRLSDSRDQQSKLLVTVSYPSTDRWDMILQLRYIIHSYQNINRQSAS